MKLFFAGLSFLVLLSACSVEKRKYFSGYNVDWYKKEIRNQKSEDSIKKKETINAVVPAKAGVSTTATDFRFHGKDKACKKDEPSLIASKNDISDFGFSNSDLKKKTFLFKYF